MTRGYNLPDNTDPNDPEAPWNKGSDDDDDDITCVGCGLPVAPGETEWIADESYCQDCAALERELTGDDIDEEDYD